MNQVPPPVAIPPPPPPPPGLAADVVASGLPVHPEDRVRLFSPVQWERFIHEWVDSLRGEYALVERCGGAGDVGRDVIAMVKGGNGVWERIGSSIDFGSLLLRDAGEEARRIGGRVDLDGSTRGWPGCGQGRRVPGGNS